MIRIATLAAAGLLLSSAAMAQEVSYDHDKTTDFSAFTTYAWVPGTPVKDDLNHKRIVEAVDIQLTAKGLVEVDGSASPDLLVAYRAGVSRDVQVSGSGVGGYRPARWGSARVKQVMVGVLVVELIDARTRKVVWRAVATDDLDPQASPEKREKKINKAAEKMFKSLRPA